MTKVDIRTESKRIASKAASSKCSGCPMKCFQGTPSTGQFTPRQTLPIRPLG